MSAKGKSNDVEMISVGGDGRQNFKGAPEGTIKYMQ